jgi:membrane-associated phospholipid phosphatase
METIWNLGLPWNLFLQDLGTWLKTPMELFSFLGNEYFFLVLLPTLYWCISQQAAVRVGVVFLLSTSLNLVLKMAFHGPRPNWYSQEVIRYASETSFGLPSGHAQEAMVVWGMLAHQLRRWWAWVAAGFIILMISISRLYLGVHFPHDVIVGLVIGGLLLALVILLWRPVVGWVKKMNLPGQILATFLVCLALILLACIPYAWHLMTGWQPPESWAAFATQAVSLKGIFTTTGTLFGFMVGLAWLSKQGGFSTAGSFWKRLLRFLLGMAGVLALYLGLDILFGLIAPETETILPFVLRFIRYTLVGAWVSAGAPRLFIQLNLAGKAA